MYIQPVLKLSEISSDNVLWCYITLVQIWDIYHLLPISFRKLFIISCLKIMFVSFEFLIILRHASCIVITNIFHFNCLRGFIKLMTNYETANQNTLLLQSLIVYKAFWWSWLYYRAFVCMLKWRSHGSTCMDGINTARTLFTVSQRQRRE